MLKKAITYTDFNGEEHTEDFYFNLTKAELIELEMGFEGGLSEGLKKIVASQDGNAIMQEFKKIILGSYGQRTSDGRRFIKNQQLRDEFESTEAYSVLFVSIVTDPEAAAEFVRGIMPQDLMAQAQLQLEQEDDVKHDPEIPDVTEPVYVPPAEPKRITSEEAEAMDAADLAAGLGSGSIKVILTRQDVLSMPQDELTEKMLSGHYEVEPQ